MAGRSKVVSLESDVQKMIVQRMKQEREKHQLTLTRMAELTGYTKSHLSMVERGQSKVSVELARQYEAVLHMDTNALLSMFQTPVTPHHRGTFENTPSAGIVMKDGLPTAELANKILRSEKRIWILENWIGDDIRDLKVAFRTAYERGVEIRIVLLDEESAIANMRNEALWRGIAQFDVKEIIQMNRTVLQEWQKEMPNLEVRFYDTLPSIQLFIIDNQATVGFYLHGLNSRRGPQLELHIMLESTYTTLGFYLEHEFIHVWDEDAKPFRLDL